MIRIGIIGVGNTIGIAQCHIRAYQKCEDAVITAVYDVIPERAEKYISEFGLNKAKACASREELYQLVDAVSICTPNATHVDLAVEAMREGKHVLVEKPLSVSAEACDAAIETAKETGKVAMVGLCYRGIPAFVYMKQLIDEGRIGKIFFVREEQGGPRIADPDVKLEWRMQRELSGPGAVADFGSHMMDICDYLLRPSCGKIREIYCMEDTCITEREVIGKTGEMGQVTNDDVACWVCRTEKGTMYNFTASRIGNMFMLEIVGEGGRLIFDGSDQFSLTVQFKDKKGGYTSGPEKVAVPENCFGSDPRAPRVPFDINFYYEIRQFLDCIEGKREPELTLERGKYIQELIMAADTSAQEKRPVELF